MNKFESVISNVFTFDKIEVKVVVEVLYSLIIFNELFEFEVKNAKSK
jgi:hypothetical protein